MNYEEIIDFLEKQVGFHKLEYLKNALDMLDLKIDPERVIVVAGTNGKGTTSATISTLLIEAKKNVGFFSSPHLKKTNERIRYNNVDISDKAFCRIFWEVRQKTGTLEFSHFEWLTLMAAYYFFGEKNVDYAVFEVGLGGTYDSTNIIPHKFCVITRLALDHMDFFGNSLVEIARNKLGIISENNIVFHTSFDPEIKKLSEEYATKYSAKFIEACNFSTEVDRSKKYPTFSVRTHFGLFKMNLPGKRAAENSTLALVACDHILNGGVSKYGYALEKVSWPGRMQRITYKGRDVFLSGDHNPNGLQSLFEILKYYNFQKIHFVVGICRTKDHSKMLEMLFAFPNSRIYLTETTCKHLPLEEYDHDKIERAEYAATDQRKVLDAAVSNASSDDLIVVTGSLYLVGKILTLK